MTIHDTLGAAMRQLADLGVAVEALQRAIAAGHVAQITCTENDPPFIPGTEAWRFTVVTLRDELCPRGWPGNYSLVINDARQINIVVASGDAFTCRSHGNEFSRGCSLGLLRPLRAESRTKSLKGLYTEAATIRNRADGDLFPETLTEDVRRVAAMLEYPTWVLLIHITDEEYRAELSLPVDMEDDQITAWKERIFIPDSSGTSGGELIVPAAGDHGPDIDVPVRRKA